MWRAWSRPLSCAGAPDQSPASPRQHQAVAASYPHSATSQSGACAVPPSPPSPGGARDVCGVKPTPHRRARPALQRAAKSGPGGAYLWDSPQALAASPDAGLGSRRTSAASWALHPYPQDTAKKDDYVGSLPVARALSAGGGWGAIPGLITVPAGAPNNPDVALS